MNNAIHYFIYTYFTLTCESIANDKIGMPMQQKASLRNNVQTIIKAKTVCELILNNSFM